MNRMIVRWAALAAMTFLASQCVLAKDWPQWRGPNGEAKATFEAPKTWPKDLTKKWSVTVGDGVATPALVGDKLYVFSRDKGKDEEVLRCLKADSGKEAWAEGSKSASFRGIDGSFLGPRCSPAVGGGKVVTVGVHGNLTCHDAETGKVLWRQDEYKGAIPKFHTSSSPIIVDKVCVAQLGGGRGVVAAFDLATGKEKWKWTGTPAYASPAVLTLGQEKLVVAETKSNVVALDAGDGKSVWEVSCETRYNASSPATEGDTVIYCDSDRGGIKAVKLVKKDGAVKANPLWSNSDYSANFATPVVKGGFLYGLSSGNKLFCLSMKDGKKAWDASVGGGGGGKGGKGGGRAGYGSIVDAGSVLMALTPAGDLIVFAPGEKEYKQLAKYPVGKKTYAYPIVSGKRIFIKDDDSLALYTVE